jgi:anthranilate synthase component I
VIGCLSGAVPKRHTQGRHAEAVSSFKRQDYLAGVKRVQEYIAAGDVYQLVLSAGFSGQHSLSPFEVYRALRIINPSPYMYYCALGDLAVVGSSPEALVRLHRGEAQLRPIAGTRPRAEDFEADCALESALRNDPKENAEHVMLVDLARNDLGRVAQSGSIYVEPYRAIERYSHVMHMVSGVKGLLASQYDAFDLFAATFPAGTLVGAPKVRAMQIIDELEPARRGLYAGTVGYFGAQGEMDQAITIRTVVMQGDQYHYQAGAGIVADSDPVAEYEEILAKSAALRRALSLAEEGL